MTGLFISILMIAACAVTPKAIIPVVEQPEVVTNIAPITYNSDSLKRDTMPKKAKVEDKQEFKALIAKNNIQKIVSTDSIVSLNYQWQKAYLRVVNRNLRSTDSLKILIVEQGRKADDYYNDAKKASYYVAQTKHAEVTSNWVFYTGFALIMLFMASNTYLSYKIKKQTA